MPFALTLAQLVLAALLTGLILWAMSEDLRDLTIPNSISIAILALFLPWAALALGREEAALRLAVAGATFLVTYGLWLAGKFGGGDVKFLSSITLWVPLQQMPLFLMVLSIVSLVIALGLLALRRPARRCAETDIAAMPWALRRAYAMARESACPYAVPIGCAGLAAAIPSLIVPLG